MAFGNIPEVGNGDNVLMKVRSQVRRCYQCGSCSNGCPMYNFMDLGPTRVIRLLQLGLFNDALKSKTLWLCVECQNCSMACPNAIPIPAIFKKLKHWSILHNIPVALPEVVAFQRRMQDSIANYGRIHELNVVLKHRLSSGQITLDGILGIKMLIKHKLDLLPSKVKNHWEIRRIFDMPAVRHA